MCVSSNPLAIITVCSSSFVIDTLLRNRNFCDASSSTWSTNTTELSAHRRTKNPKKEKRNIRCSYTPFVAVAGDATHRCIGQINRNRFKNQTKNQPVEDELETNKRFVGAHTHTRTQKSTTNDKQIAGRFAFLLIRRVNRAIAACR